MKIEMNKTHLFNFVVLFKSIQANFQIKGIFLSVVLTVSNKQVLKYNKEELMSFS